MQDELTVMFEEADFVEAFRPAPRPRKLATLVLVLALTLGLIVIILLVRFPDARSALVGSPLIIGLLGSVILVATLVLILLVAAPLARQRVARSTLNDHPGMRDPVYYAFDADQFIMRATYSQACYPWRELWDWRETERALMVMPTPRHFYVLPKRFIDEEALIRLRGYLAPVRNRAAG